MSSVVHMVHDRQMAVDEEPYSQIEWSDSSLSSSGSSSKKSKNEKLEKKKEEEEEKLKLAIEKEKEQQPIMQTNQAVEKAQEREIEQNNPSLGNKKKS